MIAARAGIVRKKSTWRGALAPLRAKGYIDGPPSSMEITDAGLDALGNDFEPLPTGRALISYWMGQIGAGDRRLFEVLLDAWPDSLSRTAAAAEADIDPAKSTWRGVVARLKGLELIEVAGDRMRVNDEIGQAW